MSKSNKDEHAHKLKRIKQGKDGKYIIFRCVLTGCTRTLRKDYVIGVLAQCWACPNKFPMSKATMQARPTCGCRRKEQVVKEAVVITDIKGPDDLKALLESVEVKNG